MIKKIGLLTGFGLVALMLSAVAVSANPVVGGSTDRANNSISNGSPVSGNQNWKPRQKSGTVTNSGSNKSSQKSKTKKKD